MSNSLNPIIKSEPFKLRLFDSPPIVPNDTALVLYPQDSKEHCSVYLQEDTVFPEAIRKWHLDRLVHISLKTFEFQHKLKYNFSEGGNQWIEITYLLSVSVKPDKDEIKIIVKNNITDISEPILEKLNNLDLLKLDKSYSCLESAALESDAFKKVMGVIDRIPYLKVTISNISVVLDDISKKRIDDDKADKIRRADIDAIEQKLIRDTQEAEARRQEAEIAKIKAEKEAELDEIRRKREMEEQKHEIEKRTKEVAAQKEYKLQQIENVEAVVNANRNLTAKFNIEDLVVADPSYKQYITLGQEKVDRDRENLSKNFDLIRQKIDIIKEMASSGVIDELAASNMTQQLLLGSATTTSQQTDTQAKNDYVEYNEINPTIREEGDDV